MRDDAGAVGGAESLAGDDVGEVEALILEADAEALLGGEPEAGDAAEGEDGEEAEEERGFLFWKRARLSWRWDSRARTSVVQRRAVARSFSWLGRVSSEASLREWRP